MALIVVDECGIGIAVAEKGQGCVIRCKEIKGFPEGLELMLQLGPETTKGFYEGLKEEFEPGPAVEVHTPADIRRAAEIHGRLQATE